MQSIRRCNRILTSNRLNGSKLSQLIFHPSLQNQSLTLTPVCSRIRLRTCIANLFTHPHIKISSLNLLMISRDCYKILNVKPDANDSDIRAAYRKRSKELHPDVNPDPKAATDFVDLAAAVAVLTDPVQRLKHDDFFGYNKSVRNQDSNVKQQFSDFQKQKAASTVNEWSADYGKAMKMRQKQRLNYVSKHKKRIQRIVIGALVAVAVSILLGILFLTSLFRTP